jgi:ribonuclease G
VNKELIVNAHVDGVEIALLENKKLVELHKEVTGNGFIVGDLYLGKIKKVVPGNNAAFVNVGFEKDGFLHYTDLSPNFKSLVKYSQAAKASTDSDGLSLSNFVIEPEIFKGGKITEVITGKHEILVQILKEPISAKGPRLSCEISIPGRYIVLTPFNNIIAVSRKIHSGDERKRLQRIVESIKPNNFGVIVRTAAEGCNTAELHNDMNDLIKTWSNIQANLQKAVAPQKILSEQNKTNSILRDLLTEDFNRIVVNSDVLFTDTIQYMQRIAPSKVDIVSQYKNTTPIFDYYGINRQVKGSFGKTVNLGSGAYIIIEHTEALHVVDVNSGYKSAIDNQEQNALETNLEAAEEIARQIRLRDIGGIIIVDFIDMKLPDNKRKLAEAMEQFMHVDRAKHAILPLSKFGLMQITRQRMRPELQLETEEVCPTCNGNGKINASLVLEDEIFKKLKYLSNHHYKQLMLQVHPIMHAYLTKGFISKRRKWSWQLKQNIKVIANESLALTQFMFFDKVGEEIKM